MSTKRVLPTGLAALALGAAVAITEFTVGATPGITPPANTISAASEVHPAQPWGPYCWEPDGTWNADCGHHRGPGMGHGHHGPGMGPGMGHGPWGPAGW